MRYSDVDYIMKNVNKILVAVIVVLVLVLAGVVVWQTWIAGPSYYAVYLRTGDLYFGELSRFPSFELQHVYMLQVNAQNNQNPISVQKFTNVFWGPEDSIKLNRDEVVWYTKLKSDSQLVKLIASNPELLPSATGAPQGTAPQGTAPQKPSSDQSKTDKQN